MPTTAVAIDLSGIASLKRGIDKNGLRSDIFNIRGKDIRLKERKQTTARKAKYYLCFSNFVDYISSLQSVSNALDLYSLDYQEVLYFLKIENNSKVTIWKQ